jgi:hypothetical protein
MPSNIVLQLVGFSFYLEQQFADFSKYFLQCEDISFWWNKYFFKFVGFLSHNKYFKRDGWLSL